ncbi:MAG TPA: sulfite exporter TauE/SafE family protein [Xanthobacteraceae bacterium]|jgi:hypothetical protein
MDGLSLESLGLFLVAAFVGGLTSGIAGFAMGLVVSGVWLHIITPVQTATLIVGYGLLTQGYGIWKLRHALDWHLVAPYIIGGAFGVPLGTMLLTYVDPVSLRIGMGLLLIAYSIWGLARPAFRPIKATKTADVVVGFLNGWLGGLTGLVGITVTIWCQLRGMTKDAQRAVFQPVTLAAAALSLVTLGLAGAVTVPTVKLYLLGTPLMLAGLWSGFKLYGKLDDEAFRNVILLLLLASGIVLLVPKSMS